MDWNKLQHTLFALDPSDPAEDLRKLKASAGASNNVAPTKDYVVESVEVPQGSMPVEGNYSIADFAALAGVKPILTEGPMDAFRAGIDSATSGALAPDSAEKAIKSVFGTDGKETKSSKTKEINRPTTKQSSILDPKLVSKLTEYEEQLKVIFSSAKLRVKFEGFLNTYAPVAKKTEEALQKKELPKPRDPNWRDMDALRKSGAGGVHKNKTDVLPRKEKHKGKKDYAVESIKEMLYRKLNESK
jgi:hypothetical protein